MPSRTLFVAIGVLLALAASLFQLRMHMMNARPLLPIIFEHLDHKAVKCITCHHNFVDNTGRDSCYFCHKQDVKVASTIERDFHVFCRDCHTSLQARGFKSGPTRQCSGCHGSTE